MNCNCYEEIAQKFLDQETYDGKNIESVEMKDVFFTFGTNAGTTGRLSYQEFEVELEGLKRPKKVKVSHVYCPYCGIKAGKIDDTIEDDNPLEKLS